MRKIINKTSSADIKKLLADLHKEHNLSESLDLEWDKDYSLEKDRTYQMLLKYFRDKACCFTGHRPQKVAWKFDRTSKQYAVVRKATKRQIKNLIKKGVKHFYCGMALGFDIMCAEIVLELKKKYKDISLHAVLPCKQQDKYWKKEDKVIYANVLNQANSVEFISENYTSYCMIKRNNYMIDKASYVIAFINVNTKGGTKRTIDYAKKQNRNIIYIDTFEKE